MAMVAMSKKCCIKNLNLMDLKYHWKNGLVGSVQGETKDHNLKNVYFVKKGGKDKSITISLFMSTFHIFAHELKTGWATRVVMAILKTRNLDDK